MKSDAQILAAVRAALGSSSSAEAMDDLVEDEFVAWFGNAKNQEIVRAMIDEAIKKRLPQLVRDFVKEAEINFR